jgi:hypothetical protein
VDVLEQLRTALGFSRASKTKRRTTRFRSRGQVGSMTSMATVVVGKNSGRNPLSHVQKKMEMGGGLERRKRQLGFGGALLAF